MNIKLFLLAVVVVALGCGLFFWQLGQQSVEDEAPTIPEPAVPAAAAPEDAENSGVGTLSALLARGESLECAVQSARAREQSLVGTVFIDDGVLRADMMTDVSASTTVSSIIVKDNWIYFWAEIAGEMIGVKFDLATVNDPEAPAVPESREVATLYEPVRYSCTQWNAVDRSVFVPPGDILFRDLSTIMEQGIEYGVSFEGEAGVPEAN